MLPRLDGLHVVQRDEDRESRHQDEFSPPWERLGIPRPRGISQTPVNQFAVVRINGAAVAEGKAPVPTGGGRSRGADSSGDRGGRSSDHSRSSRIESSGDGLDSGQDSCSLVLVPTSDGIDDVKQVGSGSKTKCQEERVRYCVDQLDRPGKHLLVGKLQSG
jgi:hypothetical protein